jgi:hypothetical protein
VPFRGIDAREFSNADGVMTNLRNVGERILKCIAAYLPPTMRLKHLGAVAPMMLTPHGGSIAGTVETVTNRCQQIKCSEE